jgi:RNA polymerase sigma factor (sigma-70 family)
MIEQPSADDEHIIRRCLSGDTDAFSVLVERYKVMVYTVAYRILGDADSANDAAQDSFVAAYGALKRFRFGSKFSTWLYAIAVNKCRDHLRAEKDTVSVDSIAELRSDPAGTPEQRLMASETRSGVQAARHRRFSKFPQRQRTQDSPHSTGDWEFDARALSGKRPSAGIEDDGTWQTLCRPCHACNSHKPQSPHGESRQGAGQLDAGN